jgi:hypothetical protein
MRLALLALLPVIPATLGCAGTVSGGSDGVDAEATTTTSAVIAVERTTDSAEGARAQATARFIRVTSASSPEEALHAIGASVDLPPRGRCATLASLADAPVAQAPVVELLDVGEVTLLAGGVETRLSPRQLPDVTDVVSGVIYARATEASLLPASARYVLHVGGASGDRGLDPIEVTATAPGDPDDVHIAGEDTPGLLVASGGTLEVRWAPTAGDDLVYVDVRPNGVRCVMDGAGHGTVSTLFLDDAGTLIVHRLHREPLGARGIDSGEVRFDFARTLAYVRR